MKTIFNKQKRSVAGVLIALTALTTALTGCQEDFELDLPLAVSARELSLTKDAGSTHVLVYSNGDWTARFTRPVKWASLNKLQGYGNNEIVFTYSANYGISRKIGVVFEKGSWIFKEELELAIKNLRIRLTETIDGLLDISHHESVVTVREELQHAFLGMAIVLILVYHYFMVTVTVAGCHLWIFLQNTDGKVGNI